MSESSALERGGEDWKREEKIERGRRRLEEGGEEVKFDSYGSIENIRKYA